MIRRAKPSCIVCDSEENLVKSYSELGGHNFMVCNNCMKVEVKPKRKPDVTTIQGVTITRGKK